MANHLEVWRPSGSSLVPLDADRVAIGRGADNAVVIDGDPAVSRLHAVVERFGAGWVLRDLGSRNGTIVNGVQLAGDRPLVTGDEIKVGSTRLVFRGEQPADSDRTVSLTVNEIPYLTRREREVLVALCRPILVGHGAFREPASVKQLAAELFVTEAAIKQHMANLYDKFALNTADERRRVRLANEAIARNAVTTADLRSDT